MTGGAVIDFRICGQNLRVFVTDAAFITEAARLLASGLTRIARFPMVQDGRDCDPVWTVLVRSLDVSGTTTVTSFTPDGRFALAYEVVNFTASNTLTFLDTTDGSNRSRYVLSDGTRAWSDQINSQGTFFSYEVCPLSCIVYVAAMPAL